MAAAWTSQGAPTAGACQRWGRLGDGTFTALRRHPVAAMRERRFSQIVAGGTHTCALDGNRKAHCWGHRFWGDFSDGGSFHWSSGAHRFGELALGTYHARGIDTVGSLRCWGPNLYGELGTDASTDWSATPVVVPGSWS